MNDHEPLLTARQLADHLGVPTGTIRTWTSQKRLPSDRVNGRVARYRLADVLEGREVRPAIPGSRRLVLDDRGALTDEAGKAS